jgi:hypothetical protein
LFYIIDGSALFRAFLSREFSEENIEFWIACEEFKKSRQSKMPNKARKIFDDFLAIRAPKEVTFEFITKMMDCYPEYVFLLIHFP